MGKCPDCGAWDALEQTTQEAAAGQDPQRGLAAAFAAFQGAAEAGGGGVELDAENAGGRAGARRLDEIGAGDAGQPRLPTGIGEFDRVLGMTAGAEERVPAVRGIVPGSAVLVGGEPGIGKSTLLLQAARGWAQRGVRVLYVSSEESAEQVKQRALRVAEESAVEVGGVGRGGARREANALGENLFVLADTNLARIVEQARQVRPRVMLIDSVQMIYKADVPAAPGSVTQLRRCCAELIYLAKLSGIAVVLVGHVTKEGNLAGPRLLEHLVDAVLYFEGERYHSHRVVRAVKNRFGTTLEIGLFEMTGTGLREVPEAGAAAGLSLGHEPRAGCVVCPTITGTRCVLVEVQALTATGFVGAAKRKSSGLDANRLAMLIAVLEQHGGLRLADRDIFASSVGGLRVVEPASDLAVLLAVAGAHYRRALAERTAAVGEVGLSGEVRPVPQLEARVREAARLGCARLIMPAAGPVVTVAGLEMVRVKDVGKAMEELG